MTITPVRLRMLLRIVSADIKNCPFAYSKYICILPFSMWTFEIRMSILKQTTKGKLARLLNPVDQQGQAQKVAGNAVL